MLRPIWIGVAAGLTAGALVGGGMFRAWQHSDRIAAGVTVAGIALGGLTPAEAQRRLRAHGATLMQRPVRLLADGTLVLTVSVDQLGLVPDWETALAEARAMGRRASLLVSLREVWQAQRSGYAIALRWRWDPARAQRVLHRLAQRLERPPQRAWVLWERGVIRVVPSRDGVRLAMAATLREWQRRIDSGNWQVLPVVLERERPAVTTEAVALIDGVVGEATTFFKASDRDRTHNIRLAAQRLDHVFIPPGETISFNDLVGPRTPRKGFRVARVLVQGQFTQDFGGGVCQVSGTLYNAALRAGMAVVRRYHHSRPIGYLPPGLDATVNFGTLDLRLRNPFPTPLYLRTFVRRGQLTVTVLGKRQPKVQYRIVRETRRFGSISTKTLPDPSLPPGQRKVVDKGSLGYRVVVWRLRVENGQVTWRERISVDTYLPQPRIVRVGVTQREEVDRLAPDAALPAKNSVPDGQSNFSNP